MPRKDYEAHKQYMRERYQAKRHGAVAPAVHIPMTPEEWEEQRREYFSMRSCCVRTALHGTIFRRRCVDHNHETGEVRKLLHKRCNMIVGFFESAAERLDAMRAYLRLEK